VLQSEYSDKIPVAPKREFYRKSLEKCAKFRPFMFKRHILRENSRFFGNFHGETGSLKTASTTNSTI